MNHQQVRDFFALNHTRPKKRLGQNFLVNPEVLEIILEAGEITGTDTAIEIGAGLGCLTDVLARRAKRVIAVEVDELLYNALVARFGVACGFPKLAVESGVACGFPKLATQKPIDSHVQLLNADILKLELNSLLSSDTGTVLYGRGDLVPTIKVIANLPYSITTPILWKLLDHHKQIHSCVLMMQKEVAERIVAEPGGKDYGALTIGVAYWTDATLITTLSPENFYPAPKVDSALLKLTMRENPKVTVENEEFFFKVVRTAFRMRRKMLKNSLVRSRLASAKVLETAFEELGIAPERRAETLDITEFAALANFFVF
jgi:16S rRNA (adenine1518-N6/adenine1519-N6)-dimethyltransferase